MCKYVLVYKYMCMLCCICVYDVYVMLCAILVAGNHYSVITFDNGGAWQRIPPPHSSQCVSMARSM